MRLSRHIVTPVRARGRLFPRKQGKEPLPPLRRARGRVGVGAMSGGENRISANGCPM